ncbi:hypothetical protein JCM10207_000855 [Rhodosporidiobolus poonsookiae]
MYFSAALAATAMASLVAADRSFTVKNNCAYTIWPAIFTSSGGAPAHATGWEAAAGNSQTFNVPEDWDGRIWGRTDCAFDGSGLPTTCSTGGCNGGLECDASTGTGVPPATLAEFNLAPADQDYYDVSNVDGFNLHMRIDNTAGCSAPSCTGDIIANCPAPLQATNSAGTVVGCRTACSANLDGNSADSANCCSGSHDTPETCPSSGVQYYDVFKNACPDAYAYAYDESSESALWTCGKGTSYTVVFCKSSPPSSAPVSR